MGDDVPLPVLASTPHMLYDYFKQRFAQVGPCHATIPMGMLPGLGSCLGCWNSAAWWLAHG